MCFSDGTGQAGVVGWNKDEVDMIGHQAVRPDADAVCRARLRQPVPIKGIVILDQEHAPAPVSALCDMVRYVRDDNARKSGHQFAPGWAINLNGVIGKVSP